MFKKKQPRLTLNMKLRKMVFSVARDTKQSVLLGQGVIADVVAPGLQGVAGELGLLVAVDCVPHQSHQKDAEDEQHRFYKVSYRISKCGNGAELEYQANEALHHQHHVAQNSLLPLLNAGVEQIDQKPILPIHIEQKPPTSAAELLKDNVASGGGGRPQVPVIKKEHKGKTPFVCGYCNKAFRDSYHLRAMSPATLASRWCRGQRRPPSQPQPWYP
ncbi:hypothetical protein F7725_007247 [Dissostichus mawsoni]|uniref:Uncharacterized protein n=1 Tax=Dissostichus mawsoni TaxID=36200 RepID=A0A7J5XWA1_DISMA|nr:hypothetical protein F7725_007247 [Dissostichus mawsoni]